SSTQVLSGASKSCSTGVVCSPPPAIPSGSTCPCGASVPGRITSRWWRATSRAGPHESGCGLRAAAEPGLFCFSASPAMEAALTRAKEIGWYHTLELAPGETTEGMFDLRPFVERYGLPERMDGMRALDVGTWDGF